MSNLVKKKISMRELNSKKCGIREMTILVLFFSTTFTFAQSKFQDAFQNIGVHYYGELLVRPGIEVDAGLYLYGKGEAKEGNQRFLRQTLSLRPAFAFYYYSNNSNNYSFSTKLNYQLQFVNRSSLRYVYVEPFIMLGYHRKSLLGQKYVTTDEGFEEMQFEGNNALLVGTGIDFGGYLNSRMDWLIGFGYFTENTEDKLILHRFAAKAGIRIKL